MSKKLLLAVACVAALSVAVSAALANDGEAKHPTTQQERFAACAHEARGTKAEEHHKFMSECLKKHEDGLAHAKEASNAPHEGQQHKMKSCNEEAGKRNLHGDERKAFMSVCLKG